MSANRHDVIVIGGGPAGATSALALARKGFDVLLLERETHPRFHIGESFLPRSTTLIQELGLAQRLAQIPQMCKLGAEFVMGDGRSPSTRFRFSDQLGAGEHVTFNLERAPFDAMLLDAARDAGAQVRQQSQVRTIIQLGDDGVELELAGGEMVRARLLVDASGQATVVGRHLKIRQALPRLQKVAYFGHFRNVWRLDGDEAGFPTIVMLREGWFWIIPLNQELTSIGLVLDSAAGKQVYIPAAQMLRWAIERCPVMHDRTSRARFPESNYVAADFSYRCAPFAGPGYFLVGDAATFVDPIFSTGVCLAMMSAVEMSHRVEAMLRHAADPSAQRRRYIQYVDGSSSVLFRLVHAFYNHHFRELFLSGAGPLEVHRAIIGILAGNVFPRPRRSLRWRLRLFEMMIAIQRLFPLVARREDFSLLEAARPDNVIGAAADDVNELETIAEAETVHEHAGA